MAHSCCDHNHSADEHQLPPLAAAQAVGASVRTPLRIVEMDCPTEEGLIRKGLQGMTEVEQLHFDLIQRVLTVQHPPEGLPAVLAALSRLGFEAQFLAQENSAAVAQSQTRTYRSLVFAVVAALAAEILHWTAGPAWLGIGLALLAIALSGVSTYKKGLIALRNRNLNINALMAIAVTGALVLGEWPEAAMVMVLFAIAEAIEARSLDRARHSVERLMDVAPPRVTVRQPNGEWDSVLASTVPLDALLRVKPGERIGLDGVVVAGQSEVDQAPITGESALQTKAVGDVVYAGTINGLGELEYRVTTLADDTLLARIIHTVHEAQSRKAPIQRFVDRFAAVYTPVVCIVAFLIAVLLPVLGFMSWYQAVYTALVLLVIACPCALVISTPVAIVSALSAAARLGILVKGGVYLEQGRHLRWLALDKTGTLTTGKPKLLDAIMLQDKRSDHDCRHIAYQLAIRSDHPVSLAIAQGLASHEDAGSLVVNDFKAIPGKGSSAQIGEYTYFLGSVAWITAILPAPVANDGPLAQLASWQEQGRTVSVLATSDQALAAFIVADAVRDTASEAIADLHRLGIQTIMLSGDNPATAAYIGQQVGIDRVQANLLPHDKLAIIEELMTEGRVGMVGDGINDAPALARADIGFAMGAIGTDTAIETADVALMDDDLRKVGRFIALSRRTRSILVQNISIALGIKAVFLLVTLLGMATMWMAVFADVGASLLVVTNSLRLLRLPKAATKTSLYAPEQAASQYV